jgi:hypothetical protein
MRVKWFIRGLTEYLSGFVVGSNCATLRRFRAQYFRLGHGSLREVIYRTLTKNELNDNTIIMVAKLYLVIKGNKLIAISQKDGSSR